jgi:hypothetical protein
MTLRKWSAVLSLLPQSRIFLPSMQFLVASSFFDWLFIRFNVLPFFFKSAHCFFSITFVKEFTFSTFSFLSFVVASCRYGLVIYVSRILPFYDHCWLMGNDCQWVYLQQFYRCQLRNVRHFRDGSAVVRIADSALHNTTEDACVWTGKKYVFQQTYFHDQVYEGHAYLRLSDTNYKNLFPTKFWVFKKIEMIICAANPFAKIF